MTTTPPSRLSQDGDSPQGAFAAHAGRDRPARAENQAPSIGSGDPASTSLLERFRDTVAFHLFRCFAICVAVILVAGLAILAGLRLAATDKPDAWSFAQLAFAQAIADAAGLIVGLCALAVALGVLGLVVFLVLAAVAARVPRPPFRPKPEPPRPERPTHPLPRT